MSIAKKIKTTIIGVLLTICCLFATLPAALTAYAATPVDGEDGTYNVSYSIAEGGMVSTMLGRYMARTVLRCRKRIYPKAYPFRYTYRSEKKRIRLL